MQLSTEFTSEQQQLLQRFLAAPERPEGTLDYFRLAGFLSAVAGAPTIVPPSRWLDAVFNEDDPGYADTDEAQAVMSAIMALYNHVNDAVVQNPARLPMACVGRAPVMRNFEDDAPLHLWSLGFAMGNGMCEELWTAWLPEQWQDPFYSSLAVLIYFADEQTAGEVMANEHGRNMEEMAEIMLDVLPEALAAYAEMGRELHRAGMEEPADEPAGPQPARSTKIGRNDPCPCGSGRKYKKCCYGASMH